MYLAVNVKMLFFFDVSQEKQSECDAFRINKKYVSMTQNIKIYDIMPQYRGARAVACNDERFVAAVATTSKHAGGFSFAMRYQL